MVTRAAQARLTPEQKAEREKVGKRVLTEAVVINRMINKAFSTTEGRVALKWIMGLCDYQGRTASYDPQTKELNVQNTLYNVARQSVYLDIRQQIKAVTLAAVENPPEGK